MAEGGPSTSVTFDVTPEVRVVTERAWSLGLCSECFGRLVGRFGHGLTNPERAHRLEVGVEAPRSVSTPCPLCGGVFDRLEVWVDRCVRAGEGWAWERFACGSRWDPERLAHEESIWAEVGTAWGESARGAFNRELGKRLASRTATDANPAAPEVLFLADIPVGRVELTVQPLVFRGRYRKLDRTLPQTRWPCRRCEGRGCDHCGGTGKMYQESVEELVAAPLLRASGGEGTRFHGMGREDIDARMLGRGRPFALEILRPHQRRFPVAPMAAAIADGSRGRVEVDDLRECPAADVVRIKEAMPEKSYRVGVSGAVPMDKVNEALRFVAGRAIAQRTPTRVAHRRADRVRTRRIVDARLVEANEGRFTLDLRAEAGTYIKEWVEGDGGRTQPNLADLLGAPLRVEFLDVLEIHDAEV